LHDGDGGTHESDEAGKGRENVRRNEASREVVGPTNPHAARAERVRRGGPRGSGPCFSSHRTVAMEIRGNVSSPRGRGRCRPALPKSRALEQDT
jgi:hypothetical protein